MKQFLTLVLAFFLSHYLEAQVTGGTNVYDFLNFSASARITGLGGNLITVRDDDVNLALANPASLNPSMHQQLGFNHVFYPAGINTGYAAYGHFVKKLDMTLHGGIQYLTYGTFDATDEVGNVTGEFKASEYAIALGAGRQLYERVTVGANLKFITSRFESYNSIGLAGDLAAMFHDTASRINVTLVFRNIGTQLSKYRDGKTEPLPFEMQVGVSKRLVHLPFRFSIVYRYLDKWNISYDDPNSQEDTFIFGDAQQSSSGNSFVDNLARHFIFSGEFLFGKKDNFRVRIGYNHLQRKEMSVKNLRSLAGFSFGAGLKINRFRVEYGRSFVHLGAGLNHFSISTNIQEFSKKR
ncbi:MAG: type IX secretion system protein PorQ [Lewinellaceae bacterium]|nr:type IX secretion system protein PorQ [Saprospiraceae bacterium]MCB9341202.1 type IX secretion system protein PorQ [Lewinellaceae bacterium]